MKPQDDKKELEDMIIEIENLDKQIAEIDRKLMELEAHRAGLTK